MDFQVGAEAPLTPNIEEHATALTALESAAQEIHKSLNSILDYQTHHRLVRTTHTFLDCLSSLNSFLPLSISFLCFHNSIMYSEKLKAENEQKIWTNAFCGGQLPKPLQFWLFQSRKFWYLGISSQIVHPVRHATDGCEQSNCRMEKGLNQH